MKLQTFFEKFDQFADAPDAVARMRGLILELAVRGKLVPQDASEEPASALLANAHSQRLALVARRAIKVRNIGLLGIETPFDLPSGWRWAQLAEVGFELGQKVPNRLFTYIDVSSIDSVGGRIGPDPQVLSPRDAPSRARKRVRQGTVIYSTVRPYLLNTAIIEGAISPEPIASTAFGVLHPVDGMSGHYLLYWLRSNSFTEYVQSEMKGMAYPAINDEKFYAGYIPVPPAAEQKRIVARVADLMSLCDRLEAQQRERKERHVVLSRAAIARFEEAPTPTNLSLLFHSSYVIAPDDLRRTILNLAVRGKLAPSDPNDESADGWFRDLAEREHRAKQGTTDVVSVAPEQAPFVLPTNWIWRKVADVFDVAGGIQKTPDRTPRKNAFPYLGVANVYRGRLDLTEVKNFELAEGELDRRRLQPSDVLIIEGNGSFNEIGRCAIWNGEIPDCVHQNHVIRCRPKDRRIAPFILMFLNSPSGVEIMQKLAITSSGLYSLSVGKIRQIKIPIPPLAEQHRIVAKVNQVMSLIDRLEREVTESNTVAERLLDAAIHELLHLDAAAGETAKRELDAVSSRVTIGCYAVRRLAESPNFGRTMLMKVCYLSETHLGLPLGWQPMRQAAGPYDPEIETFESEGMRNDWFTVTQKALSNGHSKIEYRPRSGLKAKAAEAIPALGDQKAEFDRLLNLFADKSTEEAEIIATLFAAWNDLLIDGRPASEDDIIREVRENWHPKKERFTPPRLQHWLKWMRDQRLVPIGRAPRTRQQLALALN